MCLCRQCESWWKKRCKVNRAHTHSVAACLAKELWPFGHLQSESGGVHLGAPPRHSQLQSSFFPPPDQVMIQIYSLLFVFSSMWRMEVRPLWYAC